MSCEFPYAVRLFVDNGSGYARCHGVNRPLDTIPAIDGVAPFEMLDYVPGVVAMIRPLYEKVRDLETQERQAVHAWLDSVRGLW